jgi:TIR domain
LSSLNEKLSDRTWEEETEGRVESAIATFSRECVSSPDDSSFTGAVTEMTATVEGLTRRFVSRLGYGRYGKNPAAIQRELKLPTSKIRSLSLGKAVHALRVAEAHPDFASYGDQLDERWIERLDRFADARNSWAHDDIDLRGEELLDEAYRVLSEALDLIQWLSTSTKAVHGSAEELEETERRGDIRLLDDRAGKLSVFISHSSADKRIASRLAMGLKAFDYEAWFDDWELLPGDSIVNRIETAIANTDVLLVLLSKSSVESRWVRRELSTGLARQLSGQGVMVVPVLVETCEVPALLHDTKFVDLRDDFESGFRELSKGLAARRADVAGTG